MKHLRATVESNTECLAGIHLLRIEAPAIASESRPGQYVTVHCGPDTLLRRPLSIHGASQGYIELLFRIVGPGTKWLAGQAKGSTLDILGPLGNGFTIEAGARDLLLIAGGIGIAPMVFLAREAISRGLGVKLAAGAPNQDCLVPVLIDGVDVIQVTEDGSAGIKGMVIDAISCLENKVDQAFACGPIPMYRALAATDYRFKDKSVQILLEQVMGCGTGACRGCTISTHNGMKMVCTDGPVFDLREIKWEEIAAPGISRFTLPD